MSMTRRQLGTRTGAMPRDETAARRPAAEPAPFLGLSLGASGLLPNCLPVHVCLGPLAGRRSTRQETAASASSTRWCRARAEHMSRAAAYGRPVCQSRDGDGFSAGAVCSGDLVLGHVAVNVIDVLASDTVQVLLDRTQGICEQKSEVTVVDF
jgi:hypothetical protein